MEVQEVNGFQPEYNGDNPNRAWVRQKLAEKGITVDTDAVEVIARLSLLGYFDCYEEA